MLFILYICFVPFVYFPTKVQTLPISTNYLFQLKSKNMRLIC